MQFRPVNRQRGVAGVANGEGPNRGAIILAHRDARRDGLFACLIHKSRPLVRGVEGWARDGNDFT
jgi:hypothetical protein